MSPVRLSLPTRFRPVICVIDHLGRDLTVADEAVAGRFHHAGVTLELGRRPDWRAGGLDGGVDGGVDGGLAGGLVGDEEWRIEWVKLYEGLDLAHAFSLTGDDRYLETWVELVDSFCDQLPVGADSSDVTGRRLQNWLYAAQRFAAAPAFAGWPDGFAERLTARIIADAEHLRAHLTPERNHRTLELYALLLVGLAVGDAVGDDDLPGVALGLLADNAATDIRPDGVQRESSTDYHLIVLRSLLGAIANARAAGMAVPQALIDGADRACTFAMHAQRPDGSTPSLSDGDIGRFSAVLALGGELLDRDDLRWVASQGRLGRAPATTHASFPDAGYYVQRSSWTDPTARFLVFDCGPLGDGGHGHYDQLSVEIACGDHSIVVDPGRFTYADNEWRRWFKSTAAHNTVTVDGLDQTPYRRGKPKGPQSTATLLCRHTSPGLDRLAGRVISPSYPVVHTRTIDFVDSEYWVVTDDLTAPEVGAAGFAGHADDPAGTASTAGTAGTAGSHRYDLRWHLAPGLAAITTRVVHGQPVTVVRAATVTMAVQALGASTTIEDGWVSPEYGVRHLAPVTVTTVTGAETRFVTVIVPGDVSDDDLLARLARHRLPDNPTQRQTPPDTDTTGLGTDTDTDTPAKADVPTTAGTSSSLTVLAPDPVLAYRDALLDRRAVAERLPLLFGCGPITGVHRERAKYRVGESLRVLYRFELGGRVYRAAARMFPPGASASAFVRAVRQSRDTTPDLDAGRRARTSATNMPGRSGADRCAGSRPVGLDGVWEVVWWWFPADRKLPHLGRLMAGGHSSVPGWERSELVQLGPETGATVRCLDADGTTLAFAKAYRPGHGAALAERYRHIADCLAPTDAGTSGGEALLRTPRPLVWIDDLDCLVLEPLPGCSWLDLPSDRVPAAMSELGRALAALHRITPPAGVGPFGRLAPERLATSCRLIATALPDCADLAAELDVALAATRPAPGPTVLLHGDVHPGNALFGDGPIGLIDLDQAGTGPAAADIGSLVARLTADRLLGRRHATTCDELIDAFRAGYEAGGAPWPTGVAWHTAACLAAERALRAVNRVHDSVLPIVRELLAHALQLLDNEDPRSQHRAIETRAIEHRAIENPGIELPGIELQKGLAS